MSQYGLFWDSKNGDRVYNAASMEEWLKPFFVTGVFDSQLQVTAGSGMNISVAAGYANINGKIAHFESSTALTIDITSGVEDRIDAVVIERNDSDRLFSIKVVKGTEAAEPVAPEPVRTATIYQLVLAHIFVGRGATAIETTDITDTRMSSTLCGWVSSTVNEINYDQAYLQFTTWFNEYKETIIHEFDDAGEMAQAIFDAWFTHMQGQLSTDAAGHLQLELDSQAEIIADNYSPAKLYAVGDKVTYENKLYKCISAITVRGPFDSTKWSIIQVQPQIDVIRDSLEGSTTVFNQDGSITTTYSDRVITTTFNNDGSITDEITDKVTHDVMATKTTVFNDDGSITETVV